MLDRLYGWYGKRVVWGVLVTLVLLVGAGFYMSSKLAKPDSVLGEDKKLPSVTIRSVKSLGSESSFSVVGTVRAVSEAKLQTEAGGRITSVTVNIGDHVALGTVLASIENSAEHAALLQAEGAYESAQAGALQSGAGFEEAKIGVQNVYRDTFSTTEGVVRNLADDFFTNPRGAVIGFRLNNGDAISLNATRKSIEAMFTEWSKNISGESQISESEMLASAESNTRMISDFIATLSFLVSKEDPNSVYTAEDLSAYKTRFEGARAALDGALASISRARSAFLQAQLSVSSETVSQSEAQLKSALGILRGAQANYERTLVRAPISGVVNALYLKTGDYVSPGQPAAVVANNGSLEISTSLGVQDLEYVTVGETVTIDNSATGTITKIAPAVDPITGKSEVKISIEKTETLKNGSTVSVTFHRATNEQVEDSRIVVPLSSLKMLASGPVAFIVNKENVLVALPVTLGVITGNAVEITGGLTLDSEIVTDARGLKAGDTVIVTRQ